MAAVRQSLKVFVGNLPWTIGSTELRAFGSSFGQVAYSQVIFDKKTGMSKGFGFLQFGHRDGFNAILKGGSGTYFLEGNHINVNAVTGSNASHSVSSGDEN